MKKILLRFLFLSLMLEGRVNKTSADLESSAPASADTAWIETTSSEYSESFEDTSSAVELPSSQTSVFSPSSSIAFPSTPLSQAAQYPQRRLTRHRPPTQPTTIN